MGRTGGPLLKGKKALLRKNDGQAAHDAREYDARPPLPRRAPAASATPDPAPRHCRAECPPRRSGHSSHGRCRFSRLRRHSRCHPGSRSAGSGLRPEPRSRCPHATRPPRPRDLGRAVRGPAPEPVHINVSVKPGRQRGNPDGGRTLKPGKLVGYAHIPVCQTPDRLSEAEARIVAEREGFEPSMEL